MDENQRAQFLGFGPERIEPGGGEFLTIYAGPQRRASEAQFLDAFLQLLGGQIGILQGHGGESYEPIRLFGAQFGEHFVLDFYDARGEVAIRAVPVRVDAQSLHVDALLVHHLEAFGSHNESGTLGGIVAAHERYCFGDSAVRVNIDGLHAASVHGHLASARGFGLRESFERAAMKQDPG